MEYTTESKERDALYAQLRNEAASLDTIHEMLGSGKWTMDFDESGTMTRVNWSDEFRRMLGYYGQEDFPDELESWVNLLHPDDKEHVLKEFNETIADYTGKKPMTSNTGCAPRTGVTAGIARLENPHAGQTVRQSPISACSWTSPNEKTC